MGGCRAGTQCFQVLLGFLTPCQPSPLGHTSLTQHFGEPDPSMWSQTTQEAGLRMHP